MLATEADAAVPFRHIVAALIVTLETVRPSVSRALRRVRAALASLDEDSRRRR